MRGFIDDMVCAAVAQAVTKSQSAFVRGFIDDIRPSIFNGLCDSSQSAFVRGFIDDLLKACGADTVAEVSIRVRARLHR